MRDPLPTRRQGSRPGLARLSRPVQIVRLEDREPFITADGSSIRELAGVPTGNAANQSLAEATVAARRRDDRALPPHLRGDLPVHRGAWDACGSATTRRDVRAGDAVVIPPGAPHKLLNTGPEPLVLLCCCSPAYSHEDTVLTEDA